MIEFRKTHTLWAAGHVGRIKGLIIPPVGVVFDFPAGHRLWAPAWVRRLGLEWLFRTFTGGRRTFLRNVRCVTTVGALLLRTACWRVTARRVS